MMSRPAGMATISLTHTANSKLIVPLDLFMHSRYTIGTSGVREAGENPALPRNCKRGEFEKLGPLG